MTLPLPSTTNIVAGKTKYADSPEQFFGQFSNAWDAVRCEVLKLETRQEYQEPGNPSFEAFAAGDLSKARELMDRNVENDRQLYASLRDKQVDFTRCRPLKFPLSDYMEWEMATYRYTSKEGERIFCCNYEQIDFVFEKYAQHDFMVFDSRIAFVHDYDKSGLIRGGWTVLDTKDIWQLQSLFAFIRSHCRPFHLFLDS